MLQPGVLAAVFGDCCAHPVDDDGTETWLGCPRELCERPDHDAEARTLYGHRFPRESRPYRLGIPIPTDTYGDPMPGAFDD